MKPQIRAARRSVLAVSITTMLACEGSPSPDPVAGAETPREGRTLTLEQELGIDLEGDGLEAPAGRASSPREVPAAGAPYIHWIWFADGSPTPAKANWAGAWICGGTPTAFSPPGGDLEAFQRKMLPHLEKWYADFNIILTIRKPTSANYHVSVVSNRFTSGQCAGLGGGAGGVAELICGHDYPGVSWAWRCDLGAFACAGIVAQEHAHTVGLRHTSSASDVMYPSQNASVVGFEDKDSGVPGGKCRSTQNSYKMMLANLGAWPGGPKPGVFDGTGGTSGTGGTVGSGGAGGSGGAPHRDGGPGGQGGAGVLPDSGTGGGPTPPATSDAGPAPRSRPADVAGGCRIGAPANTGFAVMIALGFLVRRRRGFCRALRRCMPTGRRRWTKPASISMTMRRRKSR